MRTNPDAVVIVSGNRLFEIEARPILRLALAALQRFAEYRFGGHATITRLPGNSFWTASTGPTRSLSAEMSKAVSKRVLEGVLHQVDGDVHVRHSFGMGWP